ncbi:hypothetical protein D3C85_1242550 [compost metagenome]
MPQLSSNIFTIGATLLVVQEAFDKIGDKKSTSSSLTPITTIGISLSGAGADINTCFAPACKCFSAPTLLANLPVASTNRSTPSSFHGKFSGLALDKT